MRVATWNLQRATSREKNSRRLDLIGSVDADICVLTEPHDVIDLAALGYRPVRSGHDPAARPRERWVTIWSPYATIESFAGRPLSAEVRMSTPFDYFPLVGEEMLPVLTLSASSISSAHSIWLSAIVQIVGISTPSAFSFSPRYLTC